MIFRITILASALLFFAGTHSPAQAWETNWSGHHLVGYKDWSEKLTPEQKLELHRYLNYQQRQPCQAYREPPEGFVKHGCELHYGAKKEKKT